MNVSVIGTGYVGLVQGVCFADTGNDVVCMDIDRAKIAKLQKGRIPIYEPGLQEFLTRNVAEGRLSFTTSLEAAVNSSNIIFLCLPTPQSEDGSADLSRVIEVAKQIALIAKGDKILVSKSTVPVGTIARIREIVAHAPKASIDVVSNPEFLKEGSALQDSMKPDRIIIGATNPATIRVLTDLYEPFVRTGNPILVMDEKSAEMSKYAANSFLATKITFMNELANLCDAVGADIEMVRRSLGSDPRIGKHFLFAGVGYGGSCFPKDVKALIQTARKNKHPLGILESVDKANTAQKSVLVRKLLRRMGGSVKGKVIAVWGIAFKPQTDDIREAPALETIALLLQEGAKVRAHDPIAMPSAKRQLGKRIRFCANAYEALRDADALLILTEWNEFRSPDFSQVKRMMRSPVIFDGRNIFDPAEMAERGFEYHGIGRGVATQAFSRRRTKGA